MSGQVKRRKVKPLQSDVHQDTRKEQIHLLPGSPEYEAYVRDRKGLDEKDFVADDTTLHAGDDRRPDKFQEPITEPEHVKNLAPDLKQSNEVSSKQGRKVGYRQYRSRILKEGENSELTGEAIQLAAVTPSKDDDAKAKHIAKHPGVRELVYDDGVVQDDYVPRGLKFLDFD